LQKELSINAIHHKKESWGEDALPRWKTAVTGASSSCG